MPSYNPKLLRCRMMSSLRYHPRLQNQWFSKQDLLAYVTDDDVLSTTSLSQLNRVIGTICCSFEGNCCLVYDDTVGNPLFYLWHNRNYCTVEEEGNKKRHVHLVSSLFLLVLIGVIFICVVGIHNHRHHLQQQHAYDHYEKKHNHEEAARRRRRRRPKKVRWRNQR